MMNKVVNLRTYRKQRGIKAPETEEQRRAERQHEHLAELLRCCYQSRDQLYATISLMEAADFSARDTLEKLPYEKTSADPWIIARRQRAERCEHHLPILRKYLEKTEAGIPIPHEEYEEYTARVGEETGCTCL